MSAFGESPYYPLKRALTEAEQHTYVRCSLHNHDRDALTEVRDHLRLMRDIVEDIIPWSREYAERAIADHERARERESQP